MKIIFLDIDGVLVTNRSLKASRTSPHAPFDEAAVSNLNNLIGVTGARVVISSSWRTDTSLDMAKVLKYAGVHCEIVGRTPILGGRGYEVDAWLSAHRSRVDRFVILEDTRDQILIGRYAENLVSTTLETGFDLQAFHRALAVLGGRKGSALHPS